MHAGLLKELIAQPLEVLVQDYDLGGKFTSNDDLGRAAFDLSPLATKDFEGASALSSQGSVSLRMRWAPAKVTAPPTGLWVRRKHV